MKRILSLLVVFAMVISMIPSVFAAKTDIDMDELLGKLVILDSIEVIDVALDEGAKEKTYKWTPDSVGTLDLGIYSVLPEDVTVVMSQGDKSITYNPEEPFALEVEPDAEVVIKVTKTAGAAIEFEMYGSLELPLGSEGNPIPLYEMENAVEAEGSVLGTATWYQSFMGGTTMTITGTAPFNVTVNGEKIPSVENAVSVSVVANMAWGIPFVFAIEEQGEYQINFEYPLGSDMNPAKLVMGENTAVIEAGTQGYYYTWTAEAGGTLTITMPEGNWFYTVNNLTSSQYGDEQTSVSDPVQSVCEIQVMDGNEIQLIVNTFDPENPYEAPSGTLTVSAAFEEAPNSETNPIIIDPVWNDDYTSATATVTAPTGTTYYGVYNLGGMMLSIDGAEPTVLESVPPMPAVFSITNDGTEEKEYTLVFTPPLGSMSNPAPLVMGENTAIVEEGSWAGYLFKWTAEADGKLTVTMPEGHWFYVINNLTTSQYGDMQYSNMDPAQPSTTIEVKAGDVIELNVNTFDPNSWVNPAGTLVVTASFEEAATYTPGDLDNDGDVDEDDAIYLLMYALTEDGDTYPVEQPVDYDKNDVIDENDAIYLLMYALTEDGDTYPIA